MATRSLTNKNPHRRLAEINRAITTSLNFDQVLQLIVENAIQLLDADASLLLLVDRDGKLRVRAACGVNKELVHSFSHHLEENVIQRLSKELHLRTGQTLISVPIIAKRSVNGLLVVAYDGKLGDEEQWELSALADQAAIALRNARLYEMELAEVNREREKTLEALRLSNARMHHILESITDLFYSLDTDWRFTDANRQTERRFGKNRSELIGRVIWDVFPDAVDSPLYPYFRRAMNERVAVHFEMRSTIVPNTWFEVHAYPSWGGLTVYLRDISERKNAEITSHLLVSIVESSDDAIISKDLNGIITSWNKGAERIFGYSADEVLGKSITILIPPDRYDEEPTILNRIRSGGYVEHYHTVRRRQDGGLIDVSLTVSPIRDEAGNIVGASKIARDITHERKSEEEIRFRARLLNAVEQAVIATNLEGKVIYWNSFAEGLYGWSADEAVGRHALDLIPAKAARDGAEEIMTRLRKGRSWSGEMLLHRRDGSEFPGMVTSSPIINDRGELVGTVGVSVDITEVKRAEVERAQLLETERLARAEAEAANRLKDEFLATLSHELRNPLNVVIGYSEILRRANEKQGDEFVSKAAEVIRRNALAQSQLVSDLLDLSRLQMGKLAINREPASLTTIVSDAIETVEAEAAGKDIKLNLQFGSETLMVNGDPVRLGQIAWNLLNNAVKFTSVGGQITISLHEENGYARFAVEDNGQGIAPDFLPHVFEIFRQADASSSRRQGGLGIGLALVKQLTELHGGRIEATSDGIGKGARFEIWLPLHSVAVANNNHRKTGGEGMLNQKRILVVDDSFETTDMLSRLLEMEGANVQTARSGAEALQIAGAKPFDLVISDISMPEMDGYQFLQKLRKLGPMTSIPAIALTGFGRAADVRRAKREGFSEHLTKPLDLEKLLVAVKKLARTRKI